MRTTLKGSWGLRMVHLLHPAPRRRWNHPTPIPPSYVQPRRALRSALRIFLRFCLLSGYVHREWPFNRNGFYTLLACYLHETFQKKTPRLGKKWAPPTASPPFARRMRGHSPNPHKTHITRGGVHVQRNMNPHPPEGYCLPTRWHPANNLPIPPTDHGGQQYYPFVGSSPPRQPCCCLHFAGELLGTRIQERRLDDPNTPFKASPINKHHIPRAQAPIAPSHTNFPSPWLHEDQCGIPVTNTTPVESSSWDTSVTVLRPMRVDEKVNKKGTLCSGCLGKFKISTQGQPFLS